MPSGRYRLEWQGMAQHGLHGTKNKEEVSVEKHGLQRPERI
jgi:hypothetical protein